MSDEITNPAELATVTDQQRARFLELLRERPHDGHIKLLREAGAKGTRGQLHAYIDQNLDLQGDIREARGILVEKLEQVRLDVAMNPEHPAWEKANFSFLTRYDDRWRQGTRVEVEHTGHIDVTKREVSLHGVLHVLAEAGVTLDDRPVAGLADIGAVLPAHTD